jgi:hypothetical protein
MVAGAVSCRSSSSPWNEDDGGTIRWIDIPAGRVKTRVYTRASHPPLPVVVMVLHGDLPDPPPSYRYKSAKVLAADRGIASAANISRSVSCGPATVIPRCQRRRVRATETRHSGTTLTMSMKSTYLVLALSSK